MRQEGTIKFDVPGWPPIKNEAKSMLAAGHAQYKSVRILLEAAAAAARATGWAPVGTNVALEVVVRAPLARPPADATNYLGGIADVLQDKSHPVNIDLSHLGDLQAVALYFNDRQVCRVMYSVESADSPSYTVRVLVINDISVEEAVVAALRELFERDHYLLHADANERSLTHKLATYLERYFPGYDVDCEYNRDGHKPKRLLPDSELVVSTDTEATTVYPDIVVHRRGRIGGNDGNLVVIEAKKTSNTAVNGDRAKLRAYKRQLDYMHAFLVRFPVGYGENPDDLSSCVESVS